MKIRLERRKEKHVQDARLKTKNEKENALLLKREKKMKKERKGGTNCIWLSAPLST